MGRPSQCGSCGECERCKRAAYMRDYYRRNPAKGREISLRSRERRIEKVREYDRERGFRGDPAKTAARNAARVLERQPCEVCGDERVHAHHDDYSKPLEVRWLCPLHHAAER